MIPYRSSCALICWNQPRIRAPHGGPLSHLPPACAARWSLTFSVAQRHLWNFYLAPVKMSGCKLLNFILMSCFSGIIPLHLKRWPIYCLCKKMTIKSMLRNSPKSIKVFCNVNGSVGLRGVSSCRPEWMPGSSKGTFFLLLACSPPSAKFIQDRKSVV